MGKQSVVLCSIKVWLLKILGNLVRFSLNYWGDSELKMVCGKLQCITSSEAVIYSIVKRSYNSISGSPMCS